ncbi:copper oxidase [Clostridium novyi]|nr:copper oxidase [Clostridium novyi]
MNIRRDNLNDILDPNVIPKYVEQLPIPKVFVPQLMKDPNTCMVTGEYYYVTAKEFAQQLLPRCFPKTIVWGYGGKVKDCSTGEIYYDYRSYPGPTFEATRGVPINVQWVNNLTGYNPLAVDPTLHWADPNEIGMIKPQDVPPFPPGLPEAQYPIPLVTHLHGGEVCSTFDGHPEAWFTSNEKLIGPQFGTSLYQYLNTQPSTALWYHDHTLGVTRLSVYMGLAGFYIIRDKNNPLDKPGCILPDRKYEIPLVIQDHTFNTDGTLYFPNVGDNPDIHPYWQPEFFGNTISVNGMTWPNLNVEQTMYRFRILNGANARFFTLKFSNNMPFLQIGSDGGYFEQPVKLEELTLAPAQRADILIDFSSLKKGTKIILTNSANAPFSSIKAPNNETVGQVMQFTVKGCYKPFKLVLPKKLNNIPMLVPNRPKRVLTLVEITGTGGPIQMLLDGQKWIAPITENPLVGSTELWELVNLTVDTHPIHLHLVQFQLQDRQKFNSDKYNSDWLNLNGPLPLNHPTKVIDPGIYLQGDPIPPDPNEKGWMDTVRAYPGEVTRILVRFAPIDADTSQVKPGKNLYPFNPQEGPGYVWHCHMLDHEDNEMMRPMVVMNKQMHKNVNFKSH